MQHPTATLTPLTVTFAALLSLQACGNQTAVARLPPHQPETSPVPAHVAPVPNTVIVGICTDAGTLGSYRRPTLMAPDLNSWRNGSPPIDMNGRLPASAVTRDRLNPQI